MSVPPKRQENPKQEESAEAQIGTLRNTSTDDVCSAGGSHTANLEDGTVAAHRTETNPSDNQQGTSIPSKWLGGRRQPEETWRECKDAGTVAIPKKVNTHTGADVTLALQNAHNKEVHRLCHHLVQEGREKLIEWFRKAVFHNVPNLHGVLKATTAPCWMLDCVAKTQRKA